MTIKEPSLEYCSLSYLNQWLVHDSIYCDAINLSVDKVKEKSDVLKKAGSFYSVARNLPTEHDSKDGLLRYQPVIEIIDAISQGDLVEDQQAIKRIKQIASEIGSKYGERNVLSLTTKFLWLKVKSPVLIYDRNARIALDLLNGNTKKDKIIEGNLGMFYSNWNKAFAEKEEKIKKVCQELSGMSLYTVDPSVATKDYIEDIASKRWFHERVFDNYLWGVGAPD